MRADLQARIIEQQTHLQCDRETELRRQRAERLAADIEVGETKTANLREELEVPKCKLLEQP